jgi:hypothetical protein
MTKAHELLADSNKWATEAYARDSRGVRCAWDNPDACQWCAVGALARVYGSGDEYAKAKQRWVPVVKRRHPGLDLDEVNDELGYEAVMAVLKEADV